MKDRAIALASSVPQHQKKNILREYLQAHILYSLQMIGAFQYLAFQGGTALRFLYQLRRFSEDLDFALEIKKEFNAEKIKDKIYKDLQMSGFNVSLHEKIKAVYALSIRISELLFESGLTDRKNENLNVHLEIDTHPPSDAHSLTTIVNRHFLLSLRHHDLPSTLAGKYHAFFTRPYTKGRDLYDLLWYLTKPDKIQPNLKFLNNALIQSGWKESPVTEENWKQRLLKQIEKCDWKEIVQDVSPFLESPGEKDLLTLENFKSLLR